ncbi:helix-turn-helix domain-containing protein [Holzapfeliella floricola]|uniref:helix-turn-helix domain-containing protein n=1 Tax=Holzapfeliella floricola TaxID=679249 RepID=UPI000782A91F|nr:helix-turn-helix domain-containing protein [Holzapfeliella floricola]
MVKFNQAFKLKIVTDYLNGKSSTNLCRQYHIAQTGTIFKWVKRYQRYGIAGLAIQKPNTKTYTFEFKLQVLDFQKKTPIILS